MSVQIHTQQNVADTNAVVPLRARQDLIVREVEYQGRSGIVVKDAVRLEYFRLRPEQYAVLRLLDGRRSLASITDELDQRPGVSSLSPEEVQRLIADLYDKGLAWSTTPGQAEILAAREQSRRRRAWLSTLRGLLFIRFPGVDPHLLLERLGPWTRWCFHPLTVLACCLLIVTAGTTTLLSGQAFMERLPGWEEVGSWRFLLTLWIALGAAKVLHELAHALACRRFGGECHEIGLALLIFSPCLYCDVSDSWLLPSKWKRIAIAAAGVYVELTISAIALLLWWRTEPGWLNQVLLCVFLVTNVSAVMFNLNPLLRLDGYYILSDWLEIPNLRQKADRVLRRTALQWLTGKPATHDPLLPERGHLAFALFAVASTLYRWSLVLVISLMLYRALQPYQLQRLGLLLGVSTAALAILGGTLRVLRSLLSHRVELWRRPARSLACFAGGLSLVGLFFLPLPSRIDAPFVVQPIDARVVYVGAPGRLESLHVQAGQTVEAGQLLARLRDDELDSRLERLRTTVEQQQIEVRMQQALGDARAVGLAEQRLETLQRQQAEALRLAAQLELRAPRSGRVIAAPPVAPSDQFDGRRLAGWSGTPLDPANAGCWLATGTPLLTIASGDESEAVLLVDRLDRNAMGRGAAARLKFDHLPQATISAVVHRVASAKLDLQATPSGERSEHSPLEQRAVAKTRLAPQTEVAYRAVARWRSDSDDISSMPPGIRGLARIQRPPQSLANRLFRFARQTLQFQLL